VARGSLGRASETHLDGGSRSHSLLVVLLLRGGLAFLLSPVLLLFLLFLFFLGPRSPGCVGTIVPAPRPCGDLPIWLHPLQQGHDSLGLWKLGDLEVLLVVGRVLADEALPPTWQGPRGLRVPLLTLTIFPG
jgi:hypothetical protein